MADSSLSCISCCFFSWQNIFGLVNTLITHLLRGHSWFLQMFWLNRQPGYLLVLVQHHCWLLQLYCEDHRKVEVRVKGQNSTLTWSTELLLTAAWQASRLGMKKWSIQGAVGEAVYGSCLDSHLWENERAKLGLLLVHICTFFALMWLKWQNTHWF